MDACGFPSFTGTGGKSDKPPIRVFHPMNTGRKKCLAPTEHQKQQISKEAGRGRVRLDDFRGHGPIDNRKQVFEQTVSTGGILTVTRPNRSGCCT
jgi:hypothetical protein